MWLFAGRSDRNGRKWNFVPNRKIGSCKLKICKSLPSFFPHLTSWMCPQILCGTLISVDTCWNLQKPFTANDAKIIRIVNFFKEIIWLQLLGGKLLKFILHIKRILRALTQFPPMTFTFLHRKSSILLKIPLQKLIR